MERRVNESINIAIRENERSVDDWELNDLARELYWWVDAFNIAFFKDQKVPVPAVSFERTNINNLGHYVVGRNAFGLYLSKYAVFAQSPYLFFLSSLLS